VPEPGARCVLLGADLGTTHCTVLAVEPDGTEVAVTREPLRTRSPRAGWAEQDARDWWEVFARAARACMSQLRGFEVVAAGVTSHLEAWVPLDHRAEPLHAGLLWLDLRTAGLAASLAEQLQDLSVFETTGVTPDYLAPAVKIAWIREALGSSWSKVARLLSPKDVLVQRLTGEAVTDPTIASKTMLYDSAAGRWAASILDALGISAGLLPPVAASPQVVGQVTAGASLLCGLPPGLPVVAGCGDDHAQALAGGALEPGDISVNTGTSSCMKIVTDRFEPRLKGLAECHAYVVPGRWLYWLPMGPTGYFVDWLIAVTAGKDPADVSPAERAALDRAAAAVPAGAEGLVFLPYAWGARLPRPDQSATGSFLGIRSVHGQPHFARAVLEGVAYQYAYARQLTTDLPVPASAAMRVLGGETRSPLWTQIKADVAGCAVEVPDAPEASAFGAALLAGVGADVYLDVADAIRQAVRVRARYEPSRDAEPYQDLFGSYDRLVGRLHPANVAENDPPARGFDRTLPTGPAASGHAPGAGGARGERGELGARAATALNADAGRERSWRR
jgi:xylulokinase